MKIKIKENIKEVFKKEQLLNNFMYKESFGETLERYAGQCLSVETDYLFDDQYNVLEDNLRVYWWAVEEVIDDIRPLYKKCSWCGRKNLKSELGESIKNCLYCGSSNLEDIIRDEKRYDFKGNYR